MNQLSVNQPKNTMGEPGDWIGPLVAWILIVMLAAIFGNSIYDARQITCEELRERKASTCKDPWEQSSTSTLPNLNDQAITPANGSTIQGSR